MASLSASLSVSIPGASQVNSRDVQLNNLNSFQRPSRLSVQRKSNRSRPNLAVRSQYKDYSRGGDFLAGFILGGAVFGTLTYIYSRELRRLIRNENEHGFQKLRRPIYLEYEESGLEKTRQVLNDKIHQLNSAIDNVSSSVMDNVSSRLKGWNHGPKVKDGVEIDSEAEAAM